jgi:hypothetical protein
LYAEVSNRWWKDIIGRWVFQREHEHKFNSLTFATAFEFREAHRNLHLTLENAIRSGEVDLSDRSVLADLDYCADSARSARSGCKQTLGWESEGLHTRRICIGGPGLPRKNRSSGQGRIEPDEQSLPGPHASSLFESERHS